VSRPWHQKIARAQNATLVAQRAVECFSQCNAHIFDSVVLVYIEIAFACEFKIKGAMAREKLEHMVEEANAVVTAYFPWPSMVSWM